MSVKRETKKSVLTAFSSMVAVRPCTPDTIEQPIASDFTVILKDVFLDNFVVFCVLSILQRGSDTGLLVRRVFGREVAHSKRISAESRNEISKSSIMLYSRENIDSKSSNKKRRHSSSENVVTAILCSAGATQNINILPVVLPPCDQAGSKLRRETEFPKMLR